MSVLFRGRKDEYYGSEFADLIEKYMESIIAVWIKMEADL